MTDAVEISLAALVRFVAACVSGVTLLLRMVFAVTPSSRVVAGTLCCAVAATAVMAGVAAEEPKRSYRLPRGEAAAVLAQFATECGRPILFMMDAVRGERTNALAGSYTPREALDRLLAGTALVAVHDPKSGGFIVHRRTAERTPPGGAGKSGPGAESATLQSKRSNTQESPSMKNRSLFALVSGLLASVAPAVRAAEVPERSALRDEAIQLTPFEVVADSDRSYGAINSNSITRFNTELSRLPVSADILTETFMRDVGVTSVEEMITTFHAGSGMSYSDAGSATTQPGDRNAESAVQIRGLYTPTMQRDGFLPLWTYSTSSTTGTGFTSNFDIERVELIKGPQSLLYGSGGGGGVINTVSKQARLGRAPFGSMSYKIDQFGSKSGQLDFGAGTKRFAVRLAAVKESTTSRRVDIGGQLEGYYAQIAVRPFKDTVVRVLGQQTDYDSTRSSNTTLNAQSAAFDARHGQYLHYLLATNQLERSASGPSGAGTIANGHLNWNNVDSFAGWLQRETTKSGFALLTADTRVTPWLSAQVAAGYKDFQAQNFNANPSMVAPNVTANPLKQWAMSAASGADDRSTLTTAIRFSVMADHSLFRGRVRGQSILGADYSRTEPSLTNIYFLRADSSFNVIRTAAGIASAIPARYWSIQDGRVARPLDDPTLPSIQYNGINYVRAAQNLADPSRVSAINPLGVRLGGESFYRLKLLNRGYYGANYMSWLDGRLNTLLGFRLASLVHESLYQGRAPTASDPDSYATKLVEVKDKLSYQFGASYALRSWLIPYVSLSSSFNPAVAQRNDPYGDIPESSEAFGHEIGLKFNARDERFSGSVAWFAVDSRKEQIRTEAQIRNYINPPGLNGTYKSPSDWMNAAREVKGIDIALTASPTRHWRMRLSAALTDGKLGTTHTYDQLYNDQFYQNSQGQVTFQDGTVVYVRPSPTTSELTNQPTVPAGTPGAIPLTVQMMSAPGNTYYANPEPVTGRVGTSNAATVLRWVDPMHGPILTGVTGLPISAMQINPGFTPPGRIPATVAGDLTTGYPKYSFNYTNLYTFSSGWAKGVRLGGTVSLTWQQRGHYYYPRGVGLDSERTLFYRPDRRRVDLIAGYERRFGRFTWNTQLNIANLFNRYKVVILPSSVTGYAGVLNAVFSEQPRACTWTNTIKF
jgi:outer membrane receptor protein involved in Fe transport